MASEEVEKEKKDEPSSSSGLSCTCVLFANAEAVVGRGFFFTLVLGMSAAVTSAVAASAYKSRYFPALGLNPQFTCQHTSGTGGALGATLAWNPSIFLPCSAQRFCISGGGAAVF